MTDEERERIRAFIRTGPWPDYDRVQPPIVAGRPCWCWSPPHGDFGYGDGLWSITLIDEPCRDCMSIDYSVWRLIAVNGTHQLYAVCKECSARRPGPLRGDDWHTSDFPLLRDMRSFAGACERCGSSDGTEEHHWAPRHLFDDYEKWPTSRLCKRCHTEWHRVVTPKMQMAQA